MSTGKRLEDRCAGDGCARAGAGLRMRRSVSDSACGLHGQFAGGAAAWPAAWGARQRIAAAKAIGTLTPVNAAVLAVAFSPRGKILATAGNENGQIRLRNVKTHRQIGRTMSAGQSDAYGVAFSPGGKTLVTTDTDGTIRQWDVATRRQIRAAIAPASAPEFLREALSPNGKILATTQFGGPAQLWDLRTGMRA
jgi:WD40 repeat protein